MKKHAIVILLSVSLLVCGCGFFRKPAQPVGTIQTNTVEGGGMTLTVELPKRHYVPGENINIRIIARNTGDQTLVFESTTSALYKVTIFRDTPLGWRWVNQYPQAMMKVLTTRELQPGMSVKYDQVIPAGRDWPTSEPLQLVAELAGAPDVKCPIIISVTDQPKNKP
jgi:hypothetical protein